MCTLLCCPLSSQGNVQHLRDRVMLLRKCLLLTIKCVVMRRVQADALLRLASIGCCAFGWWDHCEREELPQSSP